MEASLTQLEEQEKAKQPPRGEEEEDGDDEGGTLAAVGATGKLADGGDVLVALLLYMYVAPAYRRVGVGTRALDAILSAVWKAAGAADVVEAVVPCETGMAAAAMLLRASFEEVGDGACDGACNGACDGACDGGSSAPETPLPLRRRFRLCRPQGAGEAVHTNGRVQPCEAEGTVQGLTDEAPSGSVEAGDWDSVD